MDTCETKKKGFEMYFFALRFVDFREVPGLLENRLVHLRWVDANQKPAVVTPATCTTKRVHLWEVDSCTFPQSGAVKFERGDNRILSLVVRGFMGNHKSTDWQSRYPVINSPVGFGMTGLIHVMRQRHSLWWHTSICCFHQEPPWGIPTAMFAQPECSQSILG